MAFGPDANSLTSTVQGSADRLSDTYFWNSVQLTGLQPNTIYYYKVRSGEHEGQVYRFRTMPQEGGRRRMRVLLMGDHQIKSRSGYEWLMQAAKRKIEEKYGNLEENIDMIMNVGDQVDVDNLEQYEWIHFYKSKLMSPYVPIMTAVGNHETYSDPGMKNYAAHFHYERLQYKGISSGTENYYAYQAGRILFVVLSTEHTGSEQKEWVRKVVDAAKADDSVDFIISVNHRPIQAEQYIGDISSWVRNEILPILSETPKHILNFGGHHHLYHRGQVTDAPAYHIINGGASWDQLWGMSSEKDYDDVEKTIDYWGYQILDFDFDKKEMDAECYAIGNRDLVVDNILIDSFHRKLGAPEKPFIKDVPEAITLPYTFEGSEFKTTSDEPLNTVQYQISTTDDFASIVVDKVTDAEDLFGSTGKPWHIPLDVSEGVDITQLPLKEYELKNGSYYVRMRYRDNNLEWSEWSDSKAFKVVGSVDGDPVLALPKKDYAPNEEITVSYQYVIDGKNAWVGIYHSGQTPGPTPSVAWAYTKGQSGSLKFKLPDTDEYYAVLFKDEGYTEVAPRVPFYVGSVPELSIGKTSFKEGEPIEISYKAAPGLKDDWIGIYKMGGKPGATYPSISWAYTELGSSEGKVTLGEGLAKGYYFANYFTRGGYFEPAERIFFSVGEKISTVSSDKTVYEDDEDIRIDYANGPGTPKDWVGVFLEGKDPNKDMLDGFYYAYGATDGHVTIPAKDLSPGDYFCALFINDSYTEVSEPIHFTVAGDATSVDATGPKDSWKVGVRDNALAIHNGIGAKCVRLFAANGQLARTFPLVEGSNVLNISSLPSGVYIVRGAAAHQVPTTKIVRP